MKRIVIIIFCIYSTCLYADVGTIPGAYFRVVPNVGGEASYILGTIHTAVEFEEFPGDIVNQISQSKSVYVERVMALNDLNGYLNDPIGSLAKISVFTGEPVDEETREKLVKYGIPRSVAIKLTDRTCGALGVVAQVQGGRLPLDLSVISTAYLKAIPLKSLDTNEMRIKAQDRQDAESGVCSLKQVFEQYSVEEIQTYFLSQGEQELAKYKKGDVGTEEELNSPLIVSRTLDWLPEVLSGVDSGAAFIAVGQLHLYGKNGLISLLRERGYDVQEVVK